ncbi:MAG: hypothetical protein ACREPB_06820 [Arenimonas sp.]
MQLGRRLLRVFIVVIAMLVLPIIFYAALFLLVVVVSISQIGQNSGNAGPDFIASLSPVGYFFAGLIPGGGFVALLNALATPKGWWLKTIFISAILGGLVVATVDGLGDALLSISAPFLAIAASILKN